MKFNIPIIILFFTNYLFYTTLAKYQIGVGIGDCTGPAAGITFMGYAKTKQKGCGIHLRQFSRAFLFDDGNAKAVYVSVDSAMMSHGIRREVLKRLQFIYNSTYNESNLILSGTHTHGTPGGFLMDLMLDIPSFGFVRETFNALVNGIIKSIIKAHQNMVEGRVFISSGELLNANINRSPTAYLLNPERERMRYKYNVDKTMVQLKLIKSGDDSPIGAITWFAVHPTSMNNTNCLITSDNVGYASILFEQEMNKDKLLGQGPFVAAFASTNLGDVSPNLRGPRCINTGEPCDNPTSTCAGGAKFCIAFGPGTDMFDSTRIIAERLFTKANELWNGNSQREVNGPVKYIHQYVNMPKQNVTIKRTNGTIYKVHGCVPAMGYSFAAGTTDGPGEFDFSQGTTSPNAFWNTVRDFISPPTFQDIACQHPKPILINTGRLKIPYQWQSEIVSTQLFLLGDVVLIAVPGEFTTMAGRRLRDIVKRTIANHGGPKRIIPIISGLSNIYTSYITTPEEYNMQRYEGASTIYGPNTLPIYMKNYQKLSLAIIKNITLDPGPSPPDFSHKLISFVPPVLFDTSGIGRNFGDCIMQPPEKVSKGQTIMVKFISGHPRNNVMHDKTFLTVEMLLENGNWNIVATDANWETMFIWQRASVLHGGSTATIKWNISNNIEPGIYRIRHFGHYKYILGGIYHYEGSTNQFTVE